MVDLGFNIFSVFDSSGVENAQAALESLEGTSNEMDISATELSSRMEALDVTFDENMQRFRSADGTFADFNETVSNLGGEMGALGAMAERSGLDMEVVENRLAASRMEFAETEKGVSVFRDEFTGAMSETNEAMTKVSNQVRTFNEEALSALFGAMAVGRQIGDLTDPGMDAAGVFDLITNTLKLFFLPIALKVRDFVLKVRDALLGLPEGAKLVIGAMALIIGIIAKVIAVYSGLILNSGGLATAFYGLSGAASTAGAAIASGAKAAAVGVYSALGPIGVILAAITAAVVAFKIAWDKNLFGIRQKVGKFVKWIGNNLPKIVKGMNPVIGTFDLLIKAVNRLFGKDIDTLGDKFEQVGDGIANMGDSMIESGKQFDKMNEKTPEETKRGFKDKFSPDVGPSTGSQPMGASANGEPNQTNNNVRNTFNIQTREGQDSQDIANEVSRIQKKSKKTRTRER